MKKTGRRKPLKAGTRVRLKTRTVDGWKGTGTLLRDVIEDDKNAIVRFIPDDDETTTVTACRYQIAVLRDQTPPEVTARAGGMIRGMRTQLIEIENKPVLATGFIIKYDKTFREDHAFLMQHVKVFNYENKQLLTAIDHTWLWCNERAFNILMRLSSNTEKFTLNDIMNFSAIVQKYYRANGSYDWGLTLTSDFPVSLNQQKAIFKGIEKRTKELLRGRDYQEIWKRICVLLVYQTKINKNIDDWRDISKFSKKDALITISGHLSQLEGVLLPIYGQEKLNSEIEKEKLRIKNYLLRKYKFLSFES